MSPTFWLIADALWPIVVMVISLVVGYLFGTSNKRGVVNLAVREEREEIFELAQRILDEQAQQNERSSTLIQFVARIAARNYR